MKKFNSKAIQFLIYGSIALVIASCGSIKESTSTKLVQKRKYTKGFHVNLKTPKTFSSPNRMQSVEKNLAYLTPQDSTLILDEYAFISESKPEVPKDVTASASAVEIEITNEKQAFESDAVLPGKFELDEAYLIPVAKRGLRLFNKKQKAADGTVVRITPASAILSFIFGIACLFVLALPLGLVALILGIVAVSKISKNPELYKGQGFAVVGIILGAIGVIVGLIVLAAAASTV